MTRRLAALVRAAAVLSGLIAVLAAIPTLLIRLVGSPLPAALPSAAEIEDAVRYQGVDPATLVKVLALVVWLAWAQIVWVTVVEARAAVGGRIASPIRALPGLQPAIARLVAVVAVSVASMAAPRPAAAVERTPLAALVEGAVPTTPALRLPPLVTSAVPDAGPLPQWTVARHDTYWDIAEQTLGDGHAWRRIRDLNVGRVMPDGTTITATSDLLRPGWSLHLPAGAHAPESPAAEVAGPGTGVLAAGEHLWALAERELAAQLGRPAGDAEVTSYWSELLELNQDRLDDPDVVQPGQIVRLPVPEAQAKIPFTPAPTAPAAPAPPPSPPATSPRAEPHAPVDSTVPTRSAATDAPATGDSTIGAPAEDEADGVTPRTSLLGVAGSTLAAGVALAYRRRRVRLVAVHPRGHGLPVPVGFDDLRRELAETADLEGVARRDAALADLARTGADVAFVIVGDEAITAGLRHPAGPPPPGWAADDSGLRWRLDPDVAPLSSPSGSPTPLLLTVGRSADGEASIDFEALGVTAVLGEDHAVRDLLRSLAAELLHAPPDRHGHLILVGELGTLDPSPRARRADDWESVADDLVTLAAQTDALVAQRATPVIRSLRTEDTDDADGLVPTLVLLPEVPDDERFRSLCATIAGGRSGIAVVVAGPAAPAQVLQLDGEDVTAPTLGLRARRQALSEGVDATIHGLLAAADEVPVDAPLLDFGEPDDPPETPVLDDQDADVVVRVLGRVRVDGALKALTPKQVAVVTYIALHAPVTGDRIEDSVWAASTGSRKRLANTLSECRAALGPNVLPVADGGLYRLGPNATTDAALFDRAVRLSRGAGNEEKLWLATALELVEGPVFATRSADRASYSWIDFGNWVATWELKVANVALRLVELAADAGDHDTAIWAAQHALHALPTHVELTEALMRSYFQRGDLGAVERVYSSHVAALEAERLDEVAESTVDLWLRIRPRASA